MFKLCLPRNYFSSVRLLIGLSGILILFAFHLLQQSQNNFESLQAHHFPHSSPVSDVNNVLPIEKQREEAIGVNKIEANQSQNSTEAATHWFQILRNKGAIWYNQVFLGESLPNFQKWAIKNQRQAIQRELSDQLLPPGVSDWKKLTPETGGKPIRNVIFTTWRSGSTFLGQILNIHPATFYHCEPLMSFKVVQVRSGELAEKGIRIIRNALNCDFEPEQIKFGDDHFWFHTENTRIAQYCQNEHKVCSDPKFQSAMCRLFPFQVLKTVRMRLALGKHLLQDPTMDIRLLYLIRDPRATLQSRRHRHWCPGVPDCDSPKILCKDLEDDFHAAEDLRREYSNRIMILRYEDFSLNIYNAVKSIFKFFRLGYNAHVENFLRTHTTVNVGGLYSTRRNSNTTPFHWRQDFANNFKEVGEIQLQCQTAMKLWGYKMANDSAHLLTFNPVGKPPWEEMENL